VKPLYIKATTIEDAWFQCVYNIFDDNYAYEYVIEKGSFEGDTRREFFYITIEIETPYQEPWDLMLPQIPTHLNIPNPVENGYIEQYLPYLMTAEIQEGEDYTYGSRLCHVFSHTPGFFEIRINQIEYWIEVLKKTPMTNQAVLQIAQPSDCLLDDPPCLRAIDLRILGGKLHFFPQFRSWDLWGGFPANLGAIAVLQKYMADCIGVGAGRMIASSKGLHLYSYVHELAKLRANRS